MSKLIQGINDLETWCKQNKREDILDEWCYEKNLPYTPSMVVKGSGKLFFFKCSKGHIYQSSPSLRLQNCGCYFCSGHRLLAGFNDFATVYPWLLNEWDYNKNTVKPTEITKGKGGKFWWICEKGHSYEATLNHKIQGTKCPYCVGSKPIIGSNDIFTLYPELKKRWDFNKNKGVHPEGYKAGSEIKVWWHCEKGHSYERSICNEVKSKMCPICAHRNLFKFKTTKNIIYNNLIDTHPDIAKEWDYIKNYPIKPDNITYGINTPFWWICNKGHSFKASPNARTNSKTKCPYCSNKKVLKGFNDLATTNPSLAKEWHPTKNNTTPDMYTANSHVKVWWLGKCGHEWQATINNRNKGHSCHYCSGNKILKGFNDFETWCIQNNKYYLLEEWNYERNTIAPNNISKGSEKKIWWTCKNGHTWQSRLCNRTNNKNFCNCPYCNGSKTERLVYDYLKELRLSYIAEKKFEQDRVLKWYPFDIWVENKRLVIELDGIQHFSKRNGYFESNMPYENRRKNDNIKNQFCLSHSIPILRVPYTYNPDTEKDKVQQLVKDFVETRKVPDKIIEFYEQYKKDNNYAEIARQLNAL